MNIENNTNTNPVNNIPNENTPIVNTTPVNSVPSEPNTVVNTTPINSVPSEPNTVVNTTPVNNVPSEPNIVVNNTPINSVPSEPNTVVNTTPINNEGEVTQGVEDISDVANTTFDYDSIYGSKDITSNVEDKNLEEENTNKTIFKTQELNIEARSLNNRTSQDITPDFNINALDKNTLEDDSKKSDNVLSDKQKDKADTRKKIIFIGLIVIILIVFVEFIFPLINGYKF